MSDAVAPVLRSAWELPLHVAALLALGLAAGMAAKLIALQLGRPLPCLVLLCVMALCYAGRLLLWLRVGRRWQLSFVYPMMSLNYPLAGLVGVLTFAEVLTPARAAALVLIAAGVVLVARSPHRGEPTTAARAGQSSLRA